MFSAFAVFSAHCLISTKYDIQHGKKWIAMLMLTVQHTLKGMDSGESIFGPKQKKAGKPVANSASNRSDYAKHTAR